MTVVLVIFLWVLIGAIFAGTIIGGYDKLVKRGVTFTEEQHEAANNIPVVYLVMVFLWPLVIVLYVVYVIGVLNEKRGRRNQGDE